MNECFLPVGISALACALAEQLSDDDVNLLSVTLVQLGDTLATIAAQRSRNSHDTG